jgi:hypothetical protein
MNQYLVTAFNDELEKIAEKTAAIRLSRKQFIGGLVAAGISVPIIHQLVTNPSTRPGSKQNKAVKAAIKKEHRDPRLYSNIRGGLTGESRKERAAAHKRLGKGDGTILTAARQGFGRKK